MTATALRAPVTAAAVAAWFVNRAVGEPEQDLSNLKLQKLMYLAHSYYLNRNGTALVLEEFQAWENGPAVKSVYGQYKEYGNGPIAAPKSGVATVSVWPFDITEALEHVWSGFGGLSAWKLRDITHVAGPWKIHWRAGSRNVIIPGSEIGAAWDEFRPFAETATAARVDTTAAALARYGGLLQQLPNVPRSADLAGLGEEATAFADFTRRAANLLA